MGMLAGAAVFLRARHGKPPFCAKLGTPTTSAAYSTTGVKSKPARLKITHGNHRRSVFLARIFQCLAVPQQPLKLLETLERRVLKRLASAVQLRPVVFTPGHLRHSTRSTALHRPTWLTMPTGQQENWLVCRHPPKRQPVLACLPSLELKFHLRPCSRYANCCRLQYGRGKIL